MPTFFVLINSDLGADKIEKDIGKIINKGVNYQFLKVYGVYDAVLKINDNKENARELAEKIKKVSKVQSTMILTVLEDT